MRSLALLFLAGCLLFPLTTSAEELPRALPQGQLPNDARLKPLKDYDGYFLFAVPKSVDEWNVRRERVQRQILVSQGIWPLPTKTPLNPVIHGKLDRGTTPSRRSFLKVIPGFFVTGSLYRPVGKTGPRPGILCPHGHWNDGRFYDTGEAGIKKEIVQGAERFAEGDAVRCNLLYAIGAVWDVLSFITICWAMPMPNNFRSNWSIGSANKFPRQGRWKTGGLYGTQAEANLQSVMGFQTWNSIRSLDFLAHVAGSGPAANWCHGCQWRRNPNDAVGGHRSASCLCLSRLSWFRLRCREAALAKAVVCSVSTRGISNSPPSSHPSRRG